MSDENNANEGDEFGNIWITSRTRMQSHERFKKYDLLSHLVLTFYSVTLLAFSVFAEHLTDTNIGSYASEISIVLSLAVLCASLVIWGLKFSKTADEHRECYLALQRLYEDKEARVEKSNYLQILDRFPNHSDFDFEAMLYRNIWLQSKTMEDRSGPIIYSRGRAAIYLVIYLIRIAAGLVLLLFPVLFLGLLYEFG